MGVTGLVDYAHAPFAQFLEDRDVRDRPAKHQWILSAIGPGGPGWTQSKSAARPPKFDSMV